MGAESKAVGSCACGLVKFVVSLPVKWCTHCHCYACRRQHGAAIVTWVGVPWESFKLGGREHLSWYVCSETAKRGFCVNCGTPLLFMSTEWPDEVHVTRASFRGKVDIEPGGHIFFAQHVSWFPFEDSLPRISGAGGGSGISPPGTNREARRDDPEEATP